MPRFSPVPKRFALLALVTLTVAGVIAFGAITPIQVSWGDAAGVDAQDTVVSPNSSLTDPTGTVAVVRQVGPAVVTVINEQTVSGLAEGSQEAGRGTGFIINEDGNIVTNWHVVNGGDQFQVIFADGETRSATLVGSDQVSDLAIVRVDGEVPATVPLGDSNALEPGQTVVAIGSPLGTFTNTVTQGIVSALGRNNFFGSGDPCSAQYTNLIQHDAAINPGNSGGPLFNLAGEVIGVNTLGIPSSGSSPVQGLFFAVPSSTVARIAEDLIATGEVVYPFFGITGAAVTSDVAAQANLDVDFGQYVQSADAGNPAADAGIEAGDVILAVDGEQINADNSFVEVLFSHEPGDTVTATVRRGGEELSFDVTLGERPPANCSGRLP